ncbi:unnamed protein product [Nezara viridula]|uniref:Uncharacterized protein n=1 Tax=Nezara viridula TaxID=85310 RepID=A0A9P0MXK5_NEZVI|nr:unnamed protein product [Nezara viridula]
MLVCGWICYIKTSRDLWDSKRASRNFIVELMIAIRELSDFLIIGAHACSLVQAMPAFVLPFADEQDGDGISLYNFLLGSNQLLGPDRLFEKSAGPDDGDLAAQREDSEPTAGFNVVHS